MENHFFQGNWITNNEFCDLEPINVYHGELDTSFIAPEEHQNKHILFRRKFNLNCEAEKAVIYITADDYYKLYIKFCQSFDNKKQIALIMKIEKKQYFETFIFYMFLVQQSLSNNKFK